MAAGRFDDLISLCTYQVGDEGNHGTGFAVSSKLLVTCRHVVEGVAPGGDVPLVRAAADRLALTARVRTMLPAGLGGLAAEPTAAERWPDFALLELTGDDEFPTAVVLDANQPDEGAKVRVGGFASWLGYDTQIYEIGSSVSLDEAGNHYTRITDDIVDEGVSGAAVVTPNGFICGYVNASRLKGGPNGGYFVPLPDVLDAVPQLRELHDRPDAAAGEWVRRIGTAELEAVRRDSGTGDREGAYAPPVIVNLLFHETTVEGQPPRQWTVEVEGDPAAKATWQLGNLGDDLFDALDNWARRHELRTKDQVEILSRVLERAVLPDAIKQALGAVDQRRTPIFRLRTAAEDPLTAIPWEYVTSLSTSELCSFSRYIPVPPKGDIPLEGKQTIRVLVVVDPVAGVTPKSVKTELEGKFATINKEFTTQDPPRIEATVIAQPDWKTFSEAVRPGKDAVGAKWDVVHLVATAAPVGALVMPTIRSQADPVAWNTISSMLVASGAKVVVLQLGSQAAALPPPMSVYFDLLKAKSTINAQFGESMTVSETRALVLCQHITDPGDVTGFSETFYRQLALGRSVENAVQDARRIMSELASEEDYAAFGAVSVVTTMQGDIRLIEEERAPLDRAEQDGGAYADDGRTTAQRKQSTRQGPRL
ncbi:serine protease [Microbacterium pumilum]|uniref:Trypsin-like peptidase domain-containing protein n=1 Tax=Microbacterium pumilum TaxID=344165 RepID=A0ABN2RT96_9MICO